MHNLSSFEFKHHHYLHSQSLKYNELILGNNLHFMFFKLGNIFKLIFVSFRFSQLTLSTKLKLTQVKNQSNKMEDFYCCPIFL